MYFEADGVRLIGNFSAPSGSSLRDFEEVNVFLTGDISKLGWCYTKNAGGDAGDDSGWLDRLSFGDAGERSTIALTPGLVCQALDLNADNCALIDSVAADPPGRPWVLSDIATEGSLVTAQWRYRWQSDQLSGAGNHTASRSQSQIFTAHRFRSCE